MAFGLTTAQVQAFGSQPFIQKAIKNPFQIASVLSFFFVRKRSMHINGYFFHTLACSICSTSFRVLLTCLLLLFVYFFLPFDFIFERMWTTRIPVMYKP